MIKEIQLIVKVLCQPKKYERFVAYLAETPKSNTEAFNIAGTLVCLMVIPLLLFHIFTFMDLGPLGETPKRFEAIEQRLERIEQEAGGHFDD